MSPWFIDDSDLEEIRRWRHINSGLHISQFLNLIWKSIIRDSIVPNVPWCIALLLFCFSKEKYNFHQLCTEMHDFKQQTAKNKGTPGRTFQCNGLSYAILIPPHTHTKKEDIPKYLNRQWSDAVLCYKKVSTQKLDRARDNSLQQSSEGTSLTKP